MGSTAKRELAVISAGTLAVFFGASLTDTSPILLWLLENQHSPIDELLIAVLAGTLGLGFFSFRRWRELHHEMYERELADIELQMANRKLQTMVEKIQRQQEESKSIVEMADLLQSCLHIQEANDVLIRYIPRLVAGCQGGIYLFNASRNLIECVATWGEPQGESAFSQTECWALRRGKAHYATDANVPPCAHLSVKARLPYVCIPLTAHGDTIGILHLTSGVHSADSHLQDLILTISEHAALAIGNLRLRETLRNQSIRDPLTGLFNRRYLEETLEREIQNSTRKQEPIGCAMIDLDHFKRFNDSFGHEAGDLVLREVAVALKSSVRTGDIACRLGGEEFALICPGLSLRATIQRCEELRKRIHLFNLTHRGESLGMVTVSIGVSECPAHGSSAEYLLRSADDALYRAKAAGRDRIVSAGVADVSQMLAKNELSRTASR